MACGDSTADGRSNKPRKRRHLFADDDVDIAASASAAAAAWCDVSCVTTERSFTARTPSPAADHRLSACPVADRLCHQGLGVVLVEWPDMSDASVTVFVATDGIYRREREIEASL